MTAAKFAVALVFGTGALTAGTLFAVAEPPATPPAATACTGQSSACSRSACPGETACGGQSACGAETVSDTVSDEEKAALVATFNDEMDAKNYGAALAVAECTAARHADCPAAELMVWKAKFALRSQEKGSRKLAYAPSAECILPAPYPATCSGPGADCCVAAGCCSPAECCDGPGCCEDSDCCEDADSGVTLAAAEMDAELPATAVAVCSATSECDDACEAVAACGSICGGGECGMPKRRVSGSIAFAISPRGPSLAVDCTDNKTGEKLGLGGLLKAVLTGGADDFVCPFAGCPAPARTASTCGAPVAASVAYGDCPCPTDCACDAPCCCDAAPALFPDFLLPVLPPLKTAEVAPATIIPAGYAAPIAPAAPSKIPAGTYTRRVNDQTVTVTFEPTGETSGAFAGTCTVPDGGCGLTFRGDCTATRDGLIYGVVCSAKCCDAADADPVAKMAVESFCRTLIDQPFSLRCRTQPATAGEPAGLTMTDVKFAGIGIVGVPGPGEPAHLLLTMFSGAYEAE